MPPKPRSRLSADDRSTRSKLVKRCATAALLRGSLVTMRRVCGKAGCHCADGEKHVSLYLAIRVGNRRKLIYIPQEMEEKVREWVQTSREIEQLLEQLSQSCLEQILRDKRGNDDVQERATRPRKV